MPFARANSDVEVSGNAWEWWYNAAGVYARGHVPQTGSVLNFESTRGMRLGHVAVVARVVSPREIEVDQANWPRGNIERGVPVIDVSADNSWTEVRVGLRYTGGFGSTYPTYGFIYPRPATGTPATQLVVATTSVQSVSDDAVADTPRSRHASLRVHGRRLAHHHSHARMVASAHHGTRLRT